MSDERPATPEETREVLADLTEGRARPGSRLGLKLKERVTLEKFDGDPPAPGEKKLPVERIVVEDGVIISIEHPSDAKKGDG